jgi:hypothetical protein
MAAAGLLSLFLDLNANIAVRYCYCGDFDIFAYDYSAGLFVNYDFC